MNQKKLLNNVAYNVVYRVLILIVPFITAPYISRILRPEGLGLYSVTTAIAKYFWMFGLLGMANYGNRQIAAVRDDQAELSRTFSNLFYFQLIVSSIMTLLFIAYVFLIGYSHYGIAIICQIPYLFSAMFEISWYFSGTEQFRSMVIKNSIIKISTLVAVFILVKKEEDVWIYVLINTLSLVAGQIALWPLMLRQVKFTKPEFKQITKHLRPNLILMISVVAVSIYVLMDKIMIEWLSGKAHVGYYENTEKILNMTTSIVGAIGMVMLPRMTYMISNNEKDKAQTFLTKSMRYVMTFAIAITFGIAGIAKEFSVIYFGDKFAICGTTIMIVSAAIALYSWENTLKTQYLLPKKKDKVFVKGTVSAAICNLCLNLILIPKLGVIGAVIGTVGAQAAAAGYESFSVRKEIPIKKYFMDLVPEICFGAIMFIICRGIGILLGTKWHVLFIQIVVGSLVFMALTYVYYSRLNDELLLKFKNKLVRRKEKIQYAVQNLKR